MRNNQYLPGTGRGTKARSGLVEGFGVTAVAGPDPTTIGYADGPPPRTGEVL